MYNAERTLIRWLFNFCGVKNIYGSVLSNNSVTLNLHQSVGFRLTSRIPLSRMDVDGTVYLVKGNVGDLRPNRIYCQKVELSLPDFMINNDRSNKGE